MTLGSHQQCVGKSQGHITPLWLLQAIGAHGELDGLRGFDLDPCAADPRSWDCARVNWTSHGLDREWPRGWSVFLNPPFHRYEVGRWVAALAAHGNGVALLHARTEAEWFEPIWQHASGILFLADRIKFCLPDGSEQPHNSGAPAVLVAFGDDALSRLRRCGIPGVLVTNWQILPASTLPVPAAPNPPEFFNPFEGCPGCEGASLEDCGD
jgi:DNA N-6-adenine-methyltransferase (Dam)